MSLLTKFGVRASGPSEPVGLSPDTAFNFTSEIPAQYSSGNYWLKGRDGTPHQVYINMTDNGGRWAYLTNAHVSATIGTVSYDSGTYVHSMYASQRGSGSSAHFGASIDFYNLPFDVKDVAINHGGGCTYACAGPTWRNTLHIGVGIVTDGLSSFYYPGWGLVRPPDPVIDTFVCDGWSVHTVPTQANHRIHLGLGGYLYCTRVTMTNIVAIRNYG